jgi:aminobenzoyl-glutamate utilization protein B
LAEVTKEQRTAIDWIDANRNAITSLSDEIWRYAEPGFREYRSARALTAMLERHGFAIERGVAGMPTGFLATYDAGKPVLGFFAEYDATPGNSQWNVPYRSAISPYHGGFPDLHNGIGTASVAGVIALKQAMERHGLPGTVKLFGTPAEKLCAGKPFQALAGLYDGLDAVIAWHPRAYSTLEWDAGPGCYQAAVYDFHGISTYAAAPWAGASALDAMTLMNVIVQFMREHIPREYMATVNELVSVGGLHPTALPEFGQVWYVFRSPSIEGIDHVQALLTRAAEAASHALSCRFEERPVAATRPWLPNHTMARHCYQNLERTGGPRFGDEEMAFAREVQRNAELDPLDPPLDTSLTPPEAGATVEFMGGADDVTEFCWHAPTARIYIAYGLRAKGKIPNWCNAAFAATGVGHETVLAAARAMAASAIDLIQSPETLSEAWREFHERTGGKPMPVRLPDGAAAPVELTIPPYYPEDWQPPGGVPETQVR